MLSAPNAIVMLCLEALPGAMNTMERGSQGTCQNPDVLDWSCAEPCYRTMESFFWAS